jgi:hypothetical protein
LQTQVISPAFEIFRQSLVRTESALGAATGSDAGLSLHVQWAAVPGANRVSIFLTDTARSAPAASADLNGDWIKQDACFANPEWLAALPEFGAAPRPSEAGDPPQADDSSAFLAACALGLTGLGLAGARETERRYWQALTL